MSTEYWLQKKAFNSWSHVTWYPTEEEAKKNFDRVAVEGNGYSWRWVKVEVIEERLLQGERPVLRPESEDEEIKLGPTNIKPNVVQSDLGKPTGNWTGYNGGEAVLATRSEHGMVGKVWLGNPTTKEKKRVDPSLVADMMAQGWVKAGPRTVL